MKVAYLTNILPPYRKKLFEKLKMSKKFDFNFIFCTEKEDNRSWEIKSDLIEPIYLKKFTKKTKDGYNFRHIDINVFYVLIKSKPDIVIITGLYPTMLFALLYSLVFRKKIIYMTDGNINSEINIKRSAILLRKFVFLCCSSFIGASDKTIELFMKYRIPRNLCFKSCLNIENEQYFTNNSFNDRRIDILFCGQLHERKLPYLLVDVLTILKKFKLKVTIIGDGPERDNLLKEFKERNIMIDYKGSLSPEQIIKYYQNSKILFFSTRLDAWGLVANEAIASGTPVITTRFAGAADELIKNNFSGIIAEPIPEIWAEKIMLLLNNKELWNEISQNGLKIVKEYNYESAFDGIINAIEVI